MLTAAKQTSKKRFIRVLVAGAMVIGVVWAIIFGILGRKTINLNDYLEINCDGVDGYGCVLTNIDWDSLAEDHAKDITFTEAFKAEEGAYVEFYSTMDIMKKYVQVGHEKSGGNKNGDHVKYYWSVDDTLYHYLDCKLKFKDGEYKVSDLPKVATFDGFTGLHVDYLGIAPYGYINYSYDGSELTKSDFKFDKLDELSNGDIVTVSINESACGRCGTAYGKVPAETVKEYKVEGLQAYLMHVDDLKEENLNVLKETSKKIFNEKVVSGFVYNDYAKESLESFEYVGDYLLTSKEYYKWGENNILYLVFKAEVRNQYKSYDQNNEYYWAIAYKNVKLNQDGKMDIECYSCQSNDKVSFDTGIGELCGNMTFDYNGFYSLDTIYQWNVEAYSNKYNHEDHVEE